MDKKTDSIIIQILKNNEILDEEKINSCFLLAAKKNASPVPLLAEASGREEDQLLRLIAAELHLEYLDLKSTVPQDAAIKKIPIKIAAYYKFVPVSIKNRTVVIALAYPLDVKTQDEIRTHLGYNVEMVLSCETDVRDILNKYYGLGADTVEKIKSQKAYDIEDSQDKKEKKVADLEVIEDKASVIQLVNQIILEAYKKRATDIPIEPYRKKLRLRYRIDGILYDANVSPEVNNYIVPILSRIKLMSNLNIVERRVPQDGRAVVKVGDANLDLRVSFIPTPYGESVVIRILPAVMLFGLERLGLSKSELDVFKEMIKRPHGIIFVTGPTGSGKTTTLYACLSNINTSERKIITIEDPIEYELEGITQIQIVPEVGLDFARGLRSMLRHDPDVMMVGEVRDMETAEIAIRVALTGHLVFSTLHTNDAASGITRLIDIGLEPYLVASSVDAFIAQRLVRVNCPHCKEEDREVPDALKDQIAGELGFPTGSGIKIFRGKGCQQCNFTGFFGRTAIYEILMIDEHLKKFITGKYPSDRIKQEAMARGMKTLRQSGWRKVLDGITTADEILRVTQSDETGLSADAQPQKSEPRPESRPVPPVVSSPEKPDTGEREASHVSISDKRVYARLDSRVYVKYKLFNKKIQAGGLDYEPEQAGITKNISAGGLLFNTGEPLAEGTILDLVLELPGETSIRCLAKVIRSQELVPNKSYDTAVCFLDLPNSERARLNRHVLRSND